MVFTKKLRPLISNGKVTASVRIWQKPHVKVGARYPMENGYIEVTAIREIGWDDLSDKLARETGFNNLADLMKTAKHGPGQIIYFVRFRYYDRPMLQ